MSRPSREGYEWVCVAYIRNKKTGARVYPKNGRAFCFWAKKK